MNDQPSPRVQAALEELAVALHEQYADGNDDVAGFSIGGLNLGTGGRIPITRTPVPTSSFCLFRGDGSCGIYNDSDDGPVTSCTIHVW